MNNVLTALGNPIINDELKRFNEINILLNDLQYKEAIIEFLEEKIKINYLILSESLPGEINIEKLIEIIKAKDKNLKIILVREKRCQKENNNIIRNIDYQFFNNEVDVRDIIEIINNKKITEKERELLKQRKITISDINNLKMERITDEELSNYDEKDKKAAYIYYLMNKGYYYDEKIIKTYASNEEFAYVSEHVKELDCYGFRARFNNKNILYTGDTKIIEPFLKYLYNLDELYIDVSKYGGVHIKFEDVIEKLREIKIQGVNIYLMHIDDYEYINKINNGEFYFGSHRDF